MKVLVLGGSPRQKDSYQVCEEIKTLLNKQLAEEVAFEYVRLAKLNIGECYGCELCLTKGENFCPLKDELSGLVEKMKAADGLIFASPVYAYQVTGSFKKVVDRLSYLFHRPELIGKPVLTLVTSAGGGIRPTQKYLRLVACGWGCSLSEQIAVVSTRYFKDRWGKGLQDPTYVKKMQKQLNGCVKNFAQTLRQVQSGIMPVPSLYEVYLFHGLKSKSYTSEVDAAFWKKKGW